MELSLVEKSVFADIDKISPYFYGTKMFIAVFTTARH
jgi:hypothetical protein